MSTIGLLLLLMGAALVVAETHVPSHGALGTAAVTALVAGTALLAAGAGAVTGVILAAMLGAAVAGGFWLWIVVRKALATRRLAVRTGIEGLVGRVGELRAVPAPLGQVYVDGALWRARLWELEENRAVTAGDAVVVERVDGLTLTVRPAEEWELV